jgi:hypothetical protein
MMKAEFSDAYRMRNSVLVVLIACGVMAVVGMVYGVVSFAGWARYVWANWDKIGTASLPKYIGGQANAIIYGEMLPEGQRDGL